MANPIVVVKYFVQDKGIVIQTNLIKQFYFYSLTQDKTIKFYAENVQVWKQYKVWLTMLVCAIMRGTVIRKFSVIDYYKKFVLLKRVKTIFLLWGCQPCYSGEVETMIYKGVAEVGWASERDSWVSGQYNTILIVFHLLYQLYLNYVRTPKLSSAFMLNLPWIFITQHVSTFTLIISVLQIFIVCIDVQL